MNKNKIRKNKLVRACEISMIRRSKIGDKNKNLIDIIMMDHHGTFNSSSSSSSSLYWQPLKTKH